MPTYKHPCPRCGQYIARDVVACPYCGAKDPFVPGRCPSCLTPIGDARWVACPKCGAPLGPAAAAAPDAAATPGVVPPGAAPPPSAIVAADPPTLATTTSAPVQTPAQAAPSGPPAGEDGGTCRGCGSALPAGARFCHACGTLVG